MRTSAVNPIVAPTAPRTLRSPADPSRGSSDIGRQSMTLRPDACDAVSTKSSRIRQTTGDHLQAQRLVCALEDAQNPRVDVQPADRVLLRVPVSPVDLH